MGTVVKGLSTTPLPVHSPPGSSQLSSHSRGKSCRLTEPITTPSTLILTTEVGRPCEKNPG